MLAPSGHLLPRIASFPQIQFHLLRRNRTGMDKNPLDQTKLVFLKRENNPLDQVRGQIGVFVKGKNPLNQISAGRDFPWSCGMFATHRWTGGDGGRGASKWSKVMPVVMAATIRTGWRATVSIPHTPINVFLIGHRRHHQHCPCSTFAQSSNCFPGVFRVFCCFSTLCKNLPNTLYIKC